MQKFLARLLLALALAGTTATALAMNIESDKQRPWRLSLSGPITPGDADRIVRSLLDPLGNKPLLVSEIVLNSPGGNLTEALRLAALVRNLHLDTRVRSGGACASACFFVFLAGDRRVPAEHEDGQSPPGRIGLHRPFLNADTMKKGDLAFSTERQQVEMDKIVNYLRRESVPLRLIDEMMTHASNDIYWMNDEDFWKLGEYHPGLEEVLIARCRYDKRLTSPAYEKLLTTLAGNERAKGEAQLAELRKCIVDVRGSFDARRDGFVSRLKTGWRPWSDAAR